MTFSTDLFNKAYSHISDSIDKVYKDLTKGKAAPLGGVAYLNLEDTEVRERLMTTILPFDNRPPGTISRRRQVYCYAPNEAVPRYGPVIWWRKDSSRPCSPLCNS